MTGERSGIEPRLSICIPTYNRRRYLEAGLAALAPLRVRIDIEIIVSDDASSDDTPVFLDAVAARDPQVRVIHQSKRIGGFANTIRVLRAARGRYTVYHGDDDQLAHDGIVEALEFLESHSDYSAIYGPVDGFDLASGRSFGLGLHTSEIFDFEHDRRAELVAYICHGLTPEHAVYRTAGLASVLHDPGIYWSLTLLDAALRAGKTRFAPTPFYRAIQSHWPGEHRDQLFHHLMADPLAWEAFRAGLEVILSAEPGALTRPDRIAQARALIDQTIAQRQGTALDFLSAQHKWVEFVHAYRMLALRGVLPRRFPAADLFRVGLQAVVQLLLDYLALHGLGRIALVGLDDDIGPLLAEMLRAGSAETIVAQDLTAIGAPDLSTLLVVKNQRSAADAVSQGFANYATRDFAALFSAFDVTDLQASP